MLTFFIHFGLFARPIIGFQAGFYFASPIMRSSRTRRLEVMQPRIRIKSDLLECRERLWETKARNDQKSNSMPTSNCSLHKISNRHHSRWLRATKRREKVAKVTLIKSFLCSEQFEVDIYSICGFGFSRENGRFNRVGQVSSLIPWRKLDCYQIF